MNISHRAAISVRLLLTLLLIAAPLNAQRRRAPSPKPPPPPVKAAQPAVTFETILAADSYKIYGEVRGVGQLLRSTGVNDIMDPLMKLAAPPKEFKTLVRWLNTRADALMTSRLMFASWPSRPNLPQALFVIEFPSTEEAQKFQPQLKDFLPKFLPTPAPERSPNSSPGKNEPAGARTASPPPPNYILKQSGALVFISDSKFTFKELRPQGSKLLTEDPNFRQVHDRFSAESVFLYFDVASVEKEQQQRMTKMEEEYKEYKEREESAAANPPPLVLTESGPEDEVTPDVVPEELPPAELGPPQPAENESAIKSELRTEAPHETAVQGPSDLDLLASSLFFGRPKWPDAIGVAITFDADTYIVRALLINSSDGKGSAIPFAPQLISGPPLVPEASSVMPAGTELLVTLSLDLPLIYESTLKTLAGRENETRDQTIKVNQPESPFAVYEKKLGLSFKDDVLPLLGNEIALSVPAKALGVSGPQSSSAPQESTGETGAKEPAPASSGPQPVVAISIKDKEAVRTLLPKIIDAVGFKGASQMAQTEKRDDTELVTLANVISYAFIGNFLVISPDAKAVRNVVDSYLNHQTLAGNSGFRNSTRWQPRQVLGQVYISPALMESYSALSRDPNSMTNEALRDLVSRLSPTAEPVSYAISNEGLGPLHELHIPKNIILLMIGGFASASNQPPLMQNEGIAQAALRMIVGAEAAYQATQGKGNYGTLDQLIEQGLITKEILQQNGYRIDLTASGAKFEARAMPLEYGTTGKISFFVDESGVVRGSDNGGGSATSADKPVP